MPSKSLVEYQFVDGAESFEKYRPGGYHPVTIDNLLHNRYRIVEKLGYGGYSTVWLARDEVSQRYVALKAGISATSRPQREIDILRTINGYRSLKSRAELPPKTCAAVPSVLDAFRIHGPNGIHPCYTMNPAQGSLREASYSRLFPVQVARALAGKLATAVAFVQSSGFVHGDIHPRNVLVKLPSKIDELSVSEFYEKFGKPDTEPITRFDQQPLPPNVPAEAAVPFYLGKKAQKFTLADVQGLILSNFGEAFAPDTEERLGKECNIPLASTAPEALFEPHKALSYPSDIWSLGTSIWELLGMRFIFSEGEAPNELVAQRIDVLGSQDLAKGWKEQWERPEKEECADIEIPRRSNCDREAWPRLEDAFEDDIQSWRRRDNAAEIFDEEETRAILELMRGMLRFRPEERLTIDGVLSSKWMVKWALPQLNTHYDTRE